MRRAKAEKMAKQLQAPLLYFTGNDPTPELIIPKDMDPRGCTTVIISGSNNDLHQLKGKPRNLLRNEIEIILQFSRYGDLLKSTKSFVFDIEVLEEHTDLTPKQQKKVKEPNKATKLYWALQAQNKSAWGSQNKEYDLILGDKATPISGTFARRAPTTPYAGVGINADGVFQAMTVGQRISFLNKTKPFSSGGSHIVYKIPRTKYVLGKYNGRISASMKKERSQEKIHRIEQLQKITKRSFAHFPVHVDPVTSDYYAEKIDGDFFDALMSDPSINKINWVENWSPERAQQTLELFLAGVQDLHQQGWVHGDIKPENIYLQGGKLKLADWDSACTIKDKIPGARDHDTPDYSQFKIFTYAPYGQYLNTPLTQEQTFKMAKCTDLLATIQSFYFAYQDSNLFRFHTNELKTVKEMLRNILDIDMNEETSKNHTRDKSTGGLRLKFSPDGKRLKIDARYAPRDLDKIYDRVCRQVQELRTELKARMPSDYVQKLPTTATRQSQMTVEHKDPNSTILDYVTSSPNEQKAPSQKQASKDEYKPNPVSADTFERNPTAPMTRPIKDNGKSTDHKSHPQQKGPR